MAQHVATNLDGVFQCFSGGAPHDRARRIGRSVRPPGCDLEPGIDFSAPRATSLRRDQGRHQRRGPRAGGPELARQGVTANASCPAVKSDMTANIMANEKSSQCDAVGFRCGRFGEPSDFGGIAVYLIASASLFL